MKILVINCGSSSLKYQLIDMTDESVIAKGLCERIGIEGSKLNHTPKGKDKIVIEKDMKEFLFKITDETVDLKSLGIRGTDKQKMIDMLYLCYNLNDNT